MKIVFRQSSAALTPLPESAVIKARCSGVVSSPDTRHARALQTVAGPGRTKPP